jgi:hypothetical protein
VSRRPALWCLATLFIHPPAGRDARARSSPFGLLLRSWRASHRKQRHQLRSFGRCPVWIVRRTYRMLPLNRRQDLPRQNSRMLFEHTFHLSFPQKPTSGANLMQRVERRQRSFERLDLSIIELESLYPATGRSSTQAFSRSSVSSACYLNWQCALRINLAQLLLVRFGLVSSLAYLAWNVLTHQPFSEKLSPIPRNQDSSVVLLETNAMTGPWSSRTRSYPSHE